MENQLIYNKICNLQTYPHNFDPVRLLSICLLHRLYRIMWAAIFPQKSTTIVCLGFFINSSSILLAVDNFLGSSRGFTGPVNDGCLPVP